MQKKKERNEKIKEDSTEFQTDNIAVYNALYNYIIGFILRVQYILFNIYPKKFLLTL